MGEIPSLAADGTILNAIILFVMFSAPPSLNGGAGLVAYAAVFYIVWGVTYTMMDIPFWSMIPAFTESGKEREGLTTLARSCAGVGSALITVFTMGVVPVLGGGDEVRGFKYFSLIIAVLFILFTCIACAVIKEKSTVDMEAPTVKQMFTALLQNDQAVTVVIAIVLINCSLYITSNLLIYFFKYDIGGADWNGLYVLFNAFGGGIQILSMMVFYPLLRRFISASKVFYVSFISAITGYAVLLVMMLTGAANVYLLMIPGFFVFAAFGMLTVLTTVFLANTVDYGEWKNSRRDESVIFSMQTFVVKLASGVAGLLAALAILVFHISKDTSEAAAAVQLSTGSLMGLRMTMTILPIAGLLVALFYFRSRFILTDEKLAEISEQVKSRKS